MIEVLVNRFGFTPGKCLEAVRKCIELEKSNGKDRKRV